MNFEDINTIYEKYKYCSFTYELTYDDIVNNKNVDFWNIRKVDNITYKVYSNTNIFITLNYKINGSNTGNNIDLDLGGYLTKLYENQTLSCTLFIDKQYEQPNSFQRLNWVTEGYVYFAGGDPVKVYFDTNPSPVSIGTLHYDNNGDWVIEDVTSNVPVLSDDNGYYIMYGIDNISNGNEIAIIYSGNTYSLGKIIYPPNLPTVSVNPLYKGNTQTVEVLLDNEQVIPDYYTVSYEGKELKNNKINVPTDKDNINLKITLNHPEYAHTTLDYNVPLKYYPVHNFTQLSNAVDEGLTYVQAYNFTSTVSTNLVFENITLLITDLVRITVNKDASLTFINCSIIGDRYTPELCKVTSYGKFILKNMYIDSIDLTGYVELYDTEYSYGNISNANVVCYGNTILKNNSLIIDSVFISDSDNLIIENNNMNVMNMPNKEYFPSNLYLTGKLNCLNNKFNVVLSFSEADFNTALLKTVPENDIDEFINNNTFNVTTKIGNRIYTGLFYTLIDDDTLHYKEIK